MSGLFQAEWSRLRSQRGLSLIELMIGMTLGLLILGAVLYVFAGNRASYRHQESLSLVQENGRFGVDMVVWDARHAGGVGCGRGGALVDANDPRITVEFPAILQANPNAVRLSYGFVPGGINRIVDLDRLANEIELDSLAGIAVGSTIMLTDCIRFQRLAVVALDIPANTVTVNRAGLPVGAPLVAGLLNPWPETPSVSPLPFLVREGRIVNYTLVGTELRRNGDAIADSIVALDFQYGVDDISLPRVRANAEHLCTAVPSGDPRCSNPDHIVSLNAVLTVADGPINVPFETTIALRNRIFIDD